MRSYNSLNSRTLNVLVKNSNTLATVFQSNYLGNTVASSGGSGGSGGSGTDLSSYALKTDVDASFNNVYKKAYVDASFNSVYTKAYVDASFNSVYTKAYVDASFNNVYTKAYVDASFNNVYTKAYVDTSLNSLNTKLYTLTNGTIESLDTLAEISSAIKGDASFGFVVYEKIASSDLSINNLRTMMSNTTQDPSINSIILKNTAQDVSINDVYTKSYVDASFNSVYTKSYVDASFNSVYTKTYIDNSFNGVYTKTYIDNSFNGVYTKTYIDNSFNAIRTTDLSLNNRLIVGGDVSFNRNLQLGSGVQSLSINKAVNTSFALDVSGAANIVGNLSVTKRPSDTNYSIFDLTNVNLNLFNTVEKFTTLTFNQTSMTLDYSQGSIFYTTATINFAALLITNVPTTLNRSITVTLITAQSGTFYFTGTAVTVNGTSINYIKQDGTAFAAPSASRTAVIYQFNIIYASSTPTVIAFMTGYS